MTYFMRELRSLEGLDPGPLGPNPLHMLLRGSAGVAIGIKDLDGRYLCANPLLERLLGQPIGSMQGRSDTKVVPYVLLPQVEGLNRRVAKTAETVMTELDLGLDRTPLLLVGFPIFDIDSKPAFIGMMALAVSEGKGAGAALRTALETAQRTNEELRRNLREMEHLASTDRLTGTWNRCWLEQSIPGEINRFERYGHPISLLLVDIDHFKAVNDTFGHDLGDQVLVEVTKRIQKIRRASDAVVRWGGEELIVVCPNTPLASANLLAERIRTETKAKSFDGVGTVTVSIGVAELQEGEDWSPWFKRADKALYSAKENGRDQVRIAPESQFGAEGGEHAGGQLLKLMWSSAYECGEAGIDDQHRRLFRMANELLALETVSRPREEMYELSDALVREVNAHFRDEEALYSGTAFPFAERHTESHRRLGAKASRLVEQFRAGDVGVGDLFQFLVYDVIARHVLRTDKQYFPYIGSRAGTRG